MVLGRFRVVWSWCSWTAVQSLKTPIRANSSRRLATRGVPENFAAGSAGRRRGAEAREGFVGNVVFGSSGSNPATCG